MDAEDTSKLRQRSESPKDGLDRDSADPPFVGDDDLDEGLAGLGRLPNSLGLENLLTRVATYAVQTIPGADGAGLTLLEPDRADTVVWTAAFVREIDDIQYGIGQGPCITAVAEAQTVRSCSLGDDPRWRKFGGTSARLGVHSVLSLPLRTPEGVVGVMNVYAHDKDVFDARAAELGEILAGPAAIAVQNAQVLAQTQRLAVQLRSVLQTRGVVDRAVGVLMSWTGASAGEAMVRLRAVCEDDDLDLEVVAGQVLEEAVRRAEARQGD